LPGIGPWTAHYIALRALGHPDAFPAGDLVLQRQLLADEDCPASPAARAAALEGRAEGWRPWRAYAVVHAWREAALAPAQPPARSARTHAPPAARPGTRSIAGPPATACGAATTGARATARCCGARGSSWRNTSPHAGAYSTCHWRPGARRSSARSGTRWP